MNVLLQSRRVQGDFDLRAIHHDGEGGEAPMPGWTDPKDTLDFRCPICGSNRALRPELFEPEKDEVGNVVAPKVRWFVCSQGEVEYRFSVTWEQFRKHG